MAEILINIYNKIKNIYDLSDAIISEYIKVIYKTEKDNIINFFTLLDFLNNNIIELCKFLYGNEYSFERTNFILNQYIQLELFTELSFWNKSEFYVPPSGNPILWNDLIDGLIELYYGKPEKYIRAYQNLLKNKQIL